MSHYFTDDPSLKSKEKKITYTFAGQPFVFTTDAGLFSKDRTDPASDILMNTVPALTGSLLDMGCGYGCIGIVLAKTYSLTLTQADINRRALNLTQTNCTENGVSSVIIQSDCFDNITQRYDTIVINPPIHAGKSVTYKMYEGAFRHLNEGGRLYVVTLKKHGAQSTIAKLTETFGNCEILYKKKGHYVLCCRRF